MRLQLLNERAVRCSNPLAFSPSFLTGKGLSAGSGAGQPCKIGPRRLRNDRRPRMAGLDLSFEAAAVAGKLHLDDLELYYASADEAPFGSKDDFAIPIQPLVPI